MVHLYREDGPAIDMENGEKHWYINGKRHRLDGPAIIHANGGKSWYVNDKLHRLDGPAVEHHSGEAHYWINGVYIGKFLDKSNWIKEGF